MKKLWDRFRHYLISVLQDKEEQTPSETAPSMKEEMLISHQPGLVCPECNFKMPISIDMLLSGSPIECPSCGLKLSVEQEASKPILDRLRKLDGLIKNANNLTT